MDKYIRKQTVRKCYEHDLYDDTYWSSNNIYHI